MFCWDKYPERSSVEQMKKFRIHIVEGIFIGAFDIVASVPTMDFIFLYVFGSFFTLQICKTEDV